MIPFPSRHGYCLCATGLIWSSRRIPGSSRALRAGRSVRIGTAVGHLAAAASRKSPRCRANGQSCHQDTTLISHDQSPSDSPGETPRGVLNLTIASFLIAVAFHSSLQLHAPWRPIFTPEPLPGWTTWNLGIGNPLSQGSWSHGGVNAAER